MRFWDSSALVPLVVEERLSPACRRVLRADRGIVVWALTRTEMVSAVRRKQRADELTLEEAAAAIRLIERLARRWDEVDALDPVRDRAERLLAVHAVRAADALQLAAALVLYDDRPRRRPFVTLDTTLATVAESEGFASLVPR
jgi:hypothetical protein